MLVHYLVLISCRYMRMRASSYFFDFTFNYSAIIWTILTLFFFSVRSHLLLYYVGVSLKSSPQTSYLFCGLTRSCPWIQYPSEFNLWSCSLYVRISSAKLPYLIPFCFLLIPDSWWNFPSVYPSLFTNSFFFI